MAHTYLEIEQGRDEHGRDEGETHRFQPYRKFVGALGLTILGCVVVAINGSVRKVPPAGFRVGSHPAFVSYEALPVARELESNLQLCAPETVAATCKMLNGGQSSGRVRADKLHDFLACSHNSVAHFLQSAQISNWKLFGGIDCHELCEKTVAAFKNRELPNVINAGCLSDVCDVPLASSHLMAKEQGQPVARTLSKRSEIPIQSTLSAAEVQQHHLEMLHQHCSISDMKSKMAMAFKIFPPVAANIQQVVSVAPAAPARKLQSVDTPRLRKDLVIIQKKVSNALQKVQTWDKEAKNDALWFMGQNDDYAKQLIISVFQGVIKKIAQNEVSWNSLPVCNGDAAAAYGYTQSPFVKNVYICPKYLQAVELTQHETIFHELTHLKPIQTQDVGPHCYGYKNIRKMASDCESARIIGFNESAVCAIPQNNAESYTYLIFRLNGEYTGANTMEERMEADAKRRYARAKAILKSGKLAEADPKWIIGLSILSLCGCLACVGACVVVYKNSKSDYAEYEDDDY